jgi:hypothetical protein
VSSCLHRLDIRRIAVIAEDAQGVVQRGQVQAHRLAPFLRLRKFAGYPGPLAFQRRNDMRLTHAARLAKRWNPCDSSLGAVAT